MTREARVTQALVSMTDYLVSGGDVVDLLSELAATAAGLLDASACGVLLADDRGRLHLVAASTEAGSAPDLFQLQCDEGPCHECFSTVRRVSVPDLDAPDPEVTWPAFSRAARSAGFRSAHAMPMRLRDETLGAIGLLCTAPGVLPTEDADLVDALGHVAGITLVTQRIAADQQQLTTQLQEALESRVVIEQSKGLLAATRDLEMDQAFRALRKYARDHNLGLTAVARSVVGRQLRADVLLNHVGL